MKTDSESPGGAKHPRSEAECEVLLEELASFEEAIRIKPNFAKAWYGKAIVLAELGRLEDAISSFDEAIRLRPDCAEAWYSRAIALRKLKKRKFSINVQIDEPLTPGHDLESTEPAHDRLQVGPTRGLQRYVPQSETKSSNDEAKSHSYLTDSLDQNPFNLLADGESLVVDGSNLIRHVGCEPHNGKPCNNPGRMWILFQLLEQKEMWEKTTAEGAVCLTVIDASLRHHVDDQAALEDLIRKQAVVQMPPGHPSDHLVLELANDTGAVVLTNDLKMRQEYAAKYAWLKDEHRFMRYVLVSENVHKIEYMRRPFSPQGQPANKPHANNYGLYNRQKPVDRSLLKQLRPAESSMQAHPKVVLSQPQPTMPSEGESSWFRRKATRIFRHLNVLSKGDSYRPARWQVLCANCGAPIDVSNSRLRFCYRCRAALDPQELANLRGFAGQPAR